MFFKSSFFLLSVSPLTSAGLLPSWLLIGRGSEMCGVKGLADTDNNYFWSASKSLASYPGCAARCASQERCRSFGYDDSVCMLFDEPLAGNFEKNSRSYLTFYDVGCVDGSDLPDSTPSATKVQSTFSFVHVSTVHATATRTAAVSDPTVTQFAGSNGTYVNGTNIAPTSSSTISVIGSLISMPPASTPSAVTNSASTTSADDEDDGDDDSDISDTTTANDADAEVSSMTSTTTIILSSTSVVTMTSHASVPTKFPLINGNGTLPPLNATGPGAPLHRNGTSTPFVNATILEELGASS